MIYGSVCSGIEAASVAWKPLGWRCAFVSEIESFPKRVLAHHYPDVPDLGDFTKIGAEHGPVDLLVGGTPCQSFSVAGLRAGLADPRGNLMLEFGALARRLRARWLVWENVPGVLSSNGGRDFGSFLGMLGQLGYGFAYRVLDAQFFGVAQRRRRVFVVGHAGGLWQRAAAVLFEPESLRGDPAPRRAPREGVAATVGARAAQGTGDLLNDGGLTVAHATGVGFWSEGPGTLTAHQAKDTDWLIAGTLQSSGRAAGSASQQDAENGLLIPFDTTQMTSAANRSQPKPGDPCHPLAGGAHAPAVAFHVTQDPIHSSESFPCLGTGSGEGCGTLGVAYGLRADAARDGVAKTPSADAEGRVRLRDPGFNVMENLAPTVDAGVPPTVGAAMSVRRLTPRECERLQGFPDDYTAIPGAKDGPRYRALGNSFAVPVVRWIGQRIQAVEDAVNGGKP